MNAQKYKLLISDYDGTLVGQDRIISEKVKSAIRKWISAGRSFSIATGRQFRMIQHYTDDLGIKTPVITRGGAEIVDPKTGEILYSKNIDKETVNKLLKKLEDNGFVVSIEVDDQIYSDYYFRPTFQNIVTFKDRKDFEPTDVPKIVAFALSGTDSKRKIMEEIVIKEFPTLHIVEIETYEGIGWDITSLEATKHLAVLELTQMLKLKKEEVVGVGNGYNDFPLLEACGYKVAMGNANEELKEIADLVVPNYKDDGVAVLIEKLLQDPSLRSG